MADVVGLVRTNFIEPHVYAICFDKYIYIGETQSVPVKRWGGHCQSTGTFLAKLRSKGIDRIEQGRPLLFIAIRCSELLEIPEVERRLATQFVEHLVQVNTICALPTIWPIQEIISDTLVTAPAYTRHHWVERVADSAFNLISETLRNSGFSGKSIDLRHQQTIEVTL